MAVMILVLSVPGVAGVAAAQVPTVEVEAFVYPSSVTPEGGRVTYQIQVGVPPGDLPVTIISVVSDVHGDVTDPFNSAILSTECTVPIDWQPDSNFGWALGWGCGFEVWVEGESGEVSTTISVTVLFEDGTEVVVSDVAMVTISDELGAIHGVLVDSATGTPVPDVIVTVNCTPCGTNADSQGRFALEGLQPGEYFLGAGNSQHALSEYAFEFYDDAPSQETATPVMVLPGEITTIEWGLSVGGVIEGTVTDETNSEPLQGVHVEILQVTEDGTRTLFRSGAETDTNGHYRFGGLHTANYVVCFRHHEAECWNGKPTGSSDFSVASADEIHVELGQTTSGINATLQTLVSSNDGDGSTSGAGEDRTTLPHTGGRTVPIAVTATALLAAGTATLILTTRLERTTGNQPEES